MKTKVRELFYSFLSMFLFGCAIAAAVFFSMLLIPLLIVAVFVIAIKEIIVWKKKEQRQKRSNKALSSQPETAIYRTISSSHLKKAA